MIKARLIAMGAGAALLGGGGLAYHFEGEVQEVYKDPVGILTACVGHTSQDLKLGQLYTERECTELFYQDLKTAQAAVHRCTPDIPSYRTEGALISFTFNVGQGAYCRSTLAQKANEGDWVGACQEMYRWVYVGGEVLPGLVRRRDEEARVCLEGL